MGVDISAKIVKGYWISKENMAMLNQKNALDYLIEEDRLHWGDHYDYIEVQEGVAGICVDSTDEGYLSALDHFSLTETEWVKEELREVKNYLRDYIPDIDEYEMQTFVVCEVS